MPQELARCKDSGQNKMFCFDATLPATAFAGPEGIPWCELIMWQVYMDIATFGVVGPGSGCNRIIWCMGNRYQRGSSVRKAVHHNRRGRLDIDCMLAEQFILHCGRHSFDASPYCRLGRITGTNTFYTLIHYPVSYKARPALVINEDF